MVKNLNIYRKFFLFILINHFIYIINPNLFLNEISVAYVLNNNYFFPTFISILSILENSSGFTSYKFYLLIEKNKFNIENIIKFMYLQKKYRKIKFFFKYVDENKYFPSVKTFRWPLTAFYKLLLANFISENKIIYLDGDTLIFDDLSEMFNLKMNDNIMLGFADNGYKTAKYFGINSLNYICTGVLLIDLKKLREENIIPMFLDFMKQNKNKLIQVDQTVINIVLNKKIGFLPPKFGIFSFIDKKDVIRYNKYPLKEFGKTAYNTKKILRAFRNPSIVHLLRKPWKNQKLFYRNKYNKKFYKLWWNYTNNINNIIIKKK